MYIKIVDALMCQVGLFHFHIFAAKTASEDTQLDFTQGSGNSIGVPCIRS